MQRPIDKNKRSNRRCGNCGNYHEYTPGDIYENCSCGLTGEHKEYWNCCKHFSWRPDRVYTDGMSLKDAIRVLKQYQGFEPMDSGVTLRHAFDLNDETVCTILFYLKGAYNYMDQIGNPKLTVFSVTDDEETQKLLEEYSKLSTSAEKLNQKIETKQLESAKAYIRENNLGLTPGEVLVNTANGKMYAANEKQELIIY